MIKKYSILIFSAVIIFLGASWQIKAQSVTSEEISLENSLTKFTFSKEVNKLYLKNLTNFSTNYTYSFNKENFLSILIRNTADYKAGKKSPEIEYFINDICSDLTYSNSQTKTSFYFSNCSIPNIGSVNNFDLTISLDPSSKKFKWSVKTSVDLNGYALTQVGIKIPVIRDNSLTSYVVTPNFGSGELIKDPEINLKNISICGSKAGEMCGNLPSHRICGAGETPSCIIDNEIENKKNPGIQMFPYYRSNNSGIYFGYDDPNSTYTKHTIVNSNLNNGGNADFLFQHYFYVPNDLLERNSYNSSNEYNFLTGVFEGDWYDASQVYKNWVSGTPIVRKGKLPRADIPDNWETNELHMISTVSNAYDFNKQEDIDRYVNGFIRAKNYYGIPNGKMNIFHFLWYSNIGDYTPSIITNLKTIIKKLSDNGINTQLYSLSQGVSSASSYWNKYNLDSAVQKDALNEKQLVNEGFWSDVYSMDPSQKNWQDAFSKEIAVNQIQKEMGATGIYLDNPYGMKTGDYEDFYTGNHNHTYGRAGTYLFSGYAKQMEEARNAMRILNPDSYLTYEQGTEAYIGSADSFGTAGLGMNSGYLAANNFKYFKSIPFSQSIYHEYAIVGPANVGPDYLKLGSYVNNYDYLAAAGAIAGGALNDQEVIFDFGDDCMAFEMTKCYGSDGIILENHAKLIKSLIETRRNSSKFLIYGSLLRNPISYSPIQVIQLQDYSGRYYEVRDPEVLSSTWKSGDGKSSGLYLINYNDKDKSISLDLKFGDLGLQSGVKYGLYKVLSNGYQNLTQASYNFSLTKSVTPSTAEFFEFMKLPIYSNFNGQTTNFDSYPDIRSVQNATIEKVGSGKIQFNQTLNFEGLDLNNGVSISNNYISINSSKLPILNTSANLSLYGLNFKEPLILKNGSACSSSECSIKEYKNNTLSFSITGAGDYSVKEIGTISDNNNQEESSSNNNQNNSSSDSSNKDNKNSTTTSNNNESTNNSKNNNLDNSKSTTSSSEIKNNDSDNKTNQVNNSEKIGFWDSFVNLLKKIILFFINLF